MGEAADNREVTIALICAAVGLLYGSFANVVIHRVPLGQSVVRPRSACPSCATVLSAWENIPVVSWLALRGRCRTCAKPISPRYPLVEVATAALWGTVAWSVGLRPELPAMLVFVWVLLVLSVIDLATYRIPNAVLYPATALSGMLLVGAGVLSGDPGSLVTAGIGGALGFGVMALVWLAARGGLGYGDVRLSGYLGLHLGFLSVGHVPLGLFAGFATGGVVGLIMVTVGGRGRRHRLAFGPYLAIGALVALLWGDPLLDLYLGR